jgi:putative ABC transport system permease protein
MERLIQDIRYSWRTLSKSPGFTLVALLTLALGIGANSSIFSVINAALLKDLPYPKPDQLVLLFERAVVKESSGPGPAALANFLDWQAQSHSFAAMAAERENQFNLGGAERGFMPERIEGAICSWSLFPSLGVQPLLGRPFTREEDKHGARAVAVISYGLWQRRFGGSRDVLNRQIRLDSENYDIIGVMPRGFSYPERKVDVWAPVQHVLSAGEISGRGSHQFYVIARVRDGISRQQALAELDAIANQVYRAHPGALIGRGAAMRPLSEEGSRDSKTALLVLFGAVGCLLLIACVNIANLLLARGSERRREMSIRAALGAGRARLQGQLLTESVLLSLLGAAVGLVLAYGFTTFLAARAPVLLQRSDIDTTAEIGLDIWVFLFTAGVALLTGLATGLVPAWQAARTDLTAGLKESGRSSTANRSQRRFRGTLVMVEVALSVVLLVAAALLLRSFGELRNVNPGVNIDRVLTAGLSLPEARYAKREQVSAFARQVVDRLQSLPGVRSAGLVSCLPVGGYCGDRIFNIDGTPQPPGEFVYALYRAVSPGYFAAAGIPLLAGRTLNQQDNIGFDDEHPRDSAVVISQSMARKFWPNQDALGQRIRFGDEKGPHYRVVGIVGDVRIRLDEDPQPALYTSLYEGSETDFHALIHTSGDPVAIAGAVRQAISGLDPDIPAFEIRTMASVLDESAARREFTAFLLGMFAALALALAAVGLYGVLSYAVAQRTAEIGIRMALGAAHSQVRRLVLLEGMRPALAGVILGIIGAAWATQFLRTLLFGVSTRDPATFIAVPVLLLSVAIAACAIPAWRATRVHPATALRSE